MDGLKFSSNQIGLGIDSFEETDILQKRLSEGPLRHMECRTVDDENG